MEGGKVSIRTLWIPILKVYLLITATFTTCLTCGIRIIKIAIVSVNVHLIASATAVFKFYSCELLYSLKAKMRALDKLTVSIFIFTTTLGVGVCIGGLELRGGSSEEGNIFLDGRPICDDGFALNGQENALVVCRYNIEQPFLSREPFLTFF